MLVPAVAVAGPNQSGALIRDAKKLMARRQYAAACPKLQEAQRVAPSPRTLLEVALCHEKEGKTATAFAEFGTVVQQAEWEGLKDAGKTAKAHIVQLDPRLSRITVKVPPTSETDGLAVTMDGFPLARTAWGLPQPVDPGRHEIAASGPGREPWSTTIRITGDGQQQTVQVPPPTSRSQSAPLPETAAQKEARAEDPNYGEKPVVADEEVHTKKKGPKPVLGYVTAGAGLVAIGVGSYFGFRAFQLRRDSDTYCVRGCSQKGVDLNDDAKSAAWVSNVSIGLGLVGVGIGGYLLLKPVSAEEKPADSELASVRVIPELTTSSAGVTVGGSF
jgi:hypothetical protein